jgi:hypothetical protein
VGGGEATESCRAVPGAGDAGEGGGPEEGSWDEGDEREYPRMGERRGGTSKWEWGEQPARPVTVAKLQTAEGLAANKWYSVLRMAHRPSNSSMGVQSRRQLT